MKSRQGSSTHTYDERAIAQPQTWLKLFHLLKCFIFLSLFVALEKNKHIPDSIPEEGKTALEHLDPVYNICLSDLITSGQPREECSIYMPQFTLKQ